MAFPELTCRKKENKQVFSGGLLFRCFAEFHRPKAIERACFQLQTLADQFEDEEPAGVERCKKDAFSTNP